MRCANCGTECEPIVECKEYRMSGEPQLGYFDEYTAYCPACGSEWEEMEDDEDEDEI